MRKARVIEQYRTDDIFDVPDFLSDRAQIEQVAVPRSTKAKKTAPSILDSKIQLKKMATRKPKNG